MIQRLDFFQPQGADAVGLLFRHADGFKLLLHGGKDEILRRIPFIRWCVFGEKKAKS